MMLFSLLQDYKQQRPSQELVAKDLHGMEWKFRHIYRGNIDRTVRFGPVEGEIDLIQCL